MAIALELSRQSQELVRRRDENEFQIAAMLLRHFCQPGKESELETLIHEHKRKAFPPKED